MVDLIPDGWMVCSGWRIDRNGDMKLRIFRQGREMLAFQQELDPDVVMSDLDDFDGQGHYTWGIIKRRICVENVPGVEMLGIIKYPCPYRDNTV